MIFGGRVALTSEKICLLNRTQCEYYFVQTQRKRLDLYFSDSRSTWCRCSRTRFRSTPCKYFPLEGAILFWNGKLFHRPNNSINMLKLHWVECWRMITVAWLLLEQTRNRLVDINNSLAFELLMRQLSWLETSLTGLTNYWSTWLNSELTCW